MKNRHVVITRFGGPEVLSFVEDSPLPEPGPGEARVRIQARCANFTDTMIRKGKYPDVKTKPPFIPGYEMVGEIDKLGEGVEGFSVGDRVAELTVTGSYADFICLPADRLVRVPDDVDAAEAACLVLSYVTVYQMLHRSAGVAQGQSILVHGAAGAVGTAMLQLAGLAGLEVFGTASKGKHQAIEALGAFPIDYRTEDFTSVIRRRVPGGIHAAFDPIGGDNFKQSFKTLSPGGSLTAYGFYNSVQGKGGSIVKDFMWLKLADILPNGRSAVFYSIVPMKTKHPDWFREDLEALFSLLNEGKIRPVIDGRMPMKEARRAHELIENADVTGKIILVAEV